MPYLYIDDGGLESRDYTSNYVWYETEDPASFEDALRKARRLRGDRTEDSSQQTSAAHPECPRRPQSLR
jgi:hypothetical protein